MKIAILFSGQPRFVEECFPLIQRNLINHNRKDNQVDIFVHSWYDEESTGKKLYSSAVSSFSDQPIKAGAHDLIQEIYKPVSAKFDKPLEFKNDNLNFETAIDKYFYGFKPSPEMSRKQFRDIKISNMYSMWYSMLKCNLLKKEYELQNNFKYDLVVKFRFDNIVKGPINLEQFDVNCMNYIEMHQPDYMISDWFNASSSKNMDLYSSLYLNLETFADICLKEKGEFGSELMVKSICNHFKIPSQSHNLPIELPRGGKVNI